MDKSNWKVKLIAVNNYEVESKFDIYAIMPSGERKWVMMHRHDGILYNILKNGIPFEQLKNIGGRDKQRTKHLISVTNAFLSEMAQ